MARMLIGEIKANNASHVKRSSGSDLCLLLDIQLLQESDMHEPFAHTLVLILSSIHPKASLTQAYLAVLVLNSRPDFFSNASIVER